MQSLPAGTVTLLVSDIEGSTHLLARLGNRFPAALDAHRTVLRAAWARWNGHEIATEGDSFFVVFEVARDAVSAALEAQLDLAAHPWPDGEQIRVRMGVHTGEPVIHGHDYVGMDVHRALRIAASAHGGQIVVSNVTRELVTGRLAPGAVFADLGWHRFKDLAEPEHLYQAMADGLATNFPPLRSLGAATSLPVPATPLVGRDGDLAELRSLLDSDQVRLVTLTGAGGSGKTRMAIALAGSMVESLSDGVYFVGLGAVTAREAMWTAISEELGVAGDAWDHRHLLDTLGSRRILLVLDNLEQLAEASKVVSEILAGASGTVVVATSRRPLHLRGEHEHLVRPLGLPDEARPDALAPSEAVLMFAQQAELVRPSFRLTPENIEDVAAICRRLDGLPLAIELAASRAKLLTPSALLARLDQTMGLCAFDGDRPLRQQTLHDAIAWSYDLLPAGMQRTFRQVGVFAGGCDLEAIATVIVSDRDPLDVVAELVDVSLATIEDGPDGEPRVALLQTVADFARDRLTEAGELDDVRRRHTDCYLALVEDQAALLSGPRRLSARDRLVTDYDNVIAALTWALERVEEDGPDPVWADVPLRLAGALWPFWDATGRFREGQEWLTAALSQEGDHAPLVQAEALSGLGTFAWRQGDFETATELHAAALALQERAGDDAGAAYSLNHLGAQALCREDYEAAEAYFERVSKRTVDLRVRTYVLVNSGEVAKHRREYDRAVQMLREAMDLAARIADEWLLAGAVVNLGLVAVLTGDLPLAAESLGDGLRHASRLRDRCSVALSLDGSAQLALAMSRPRLAAPVLGAAGALREAIGAVLSRQDAPDRDAALVAAREVLGEQTFASLYEEGNGLSFDEAVELGERVLAECSANLGEATSAPR